MRLSTLGTKFFQLMAWFSSLAMCFRGLKFWNYGSDCTDFLGYQLWRIYPKHHNQPPQLHPKLQLPNFSLFLISPNRPYNWKFKPIFPTSRKKGQLDLSVHLDLKIILNKITSSFEKKNSKKRINGPKKTLEFAIISMDRWTGSRKIFDKLQLMYINFSLFIQPCINWLSTQLKRHNRSNEMFSSYYDGKMK